MKKVVHVFTVSLSVIFLEDIYSKLKERGYELIVICSEGEEVRHLEKTGNLRYYPVEISRGINPFKDLISLVKIIKILIKERPLIVHGHTPKGGLLGMLAAKLVGIKFRPYHLHGLKFAGEHGIRKKIIRAMEKATIALSTEVFSVSQSLREYAINEKLGKAEKINIILNGSVKGIDLEKSQKILEQGSFYYRERLRFNKSDCIIGFIGRITEEKGIMELISATKRLIEEGYDIGLVLCGPNEMIHLNNKNEFFKFTQLENIQYFGKVDNPLEYMVGFDMFVLPSYREGFGLVNIEANSVGVPVITTNIVGCIDSIDDNVTGITIKPKDMEALYFAIKKLIDNPEQRKKMGINGIERTRKFYNRNLIWSTLIDKYDGMLRKEV